MSETPLLFVLFGATGDLARLKILPALVNLQTQNTLGRSVKLIATGRREMTPNQYFEYLAKVEPHPFTQDSSSLDPHYIQLEFDGEDGFANLWELLRQYPDSEIVFYMAVGAEVLEQAITRFQDDSATEFIQQRKVKVLVEKPFGRSLEEAVRFNKILTGIFSADNVYRDDHYLFKNTVQTLTTIKNTDPDMVEILNSEWIQEIRLVVSEEVDLGTRAGYFEGVGMLKDWFQSHILQMLALLCASPSESDRENGTGKQNFIATLQPIPQSLIRAQYEGYVGSAGVDPHSLTETFLAMRMQSQLQRWQGTEFAIVCGKAMAEKEVNFHITLRKEHPKFGKQIELNLSKATGHPLLAGKHDGDEFGRLISDLVNNNKTCFPTEGEVEAQWQITEKIGSMLADVPMDNYTKGTSYATFCTKYWC